MGDAWVDVATTGGCAGWLEWNEGKQEALQNFTLFIPLPFSSPGRALDLVLTEPNAGLPFVALFEV